eukprot:UN32782
MSDEYAHYFGEYYSYGSLQAAVTWEPTDNKKDKNVHNIITAKTVQNKNTPLVAIRTDKNAPVVVMNVYTNDQYPAAIKLLAKVIELAVLKVRETEQEGILRDFLKNSLCLATIDTVGYLANKLPTSGSLDYSVDHTKYFEDQ